ncbi:MAG: hypothetical protein ACLS3Y_05015 [Collinsella sp.]
MTRDEFLGRLGELLACLPAEQVENQGVLKTIADRGGHMSESRGRHGHAREVGGHADDCHRAAAIADAPAAPRCCGLPSWAPRCGCRARRSPPWRTVYIIWVRSLWIVAAASGAWA